MTRRMLFPALVFAVACGGGGGSTDAGMEDTGVSRPDGGSDSGDMMDGSVDTGTVPMDAGVDAAPQPCSTEGEMRAVMCGNCGLAQQVCTASLWVEGECLAQGECAPGSVDEETLPDCTMRARICDTMCAYSAWEVRTPGGECDAGSSRTVSGSCTGDHVQPQVCSASCAWEDAGSCTGACGTLRTTPADAAEVCIPAGAFTRGDPTIADAPPHEVTLSAYAIDVYPVTIRRYHECMMAGACPMPTSEICDVPPDFSASGIQDRVLEWVTRDQAQAFCSWDGGRRLPTEAEWEKAARGPAPRTNAWPWGDAPNCALLPAFPCAAPSSLPPFPSVPITQWPGTQSFYGTYQIGLGLEWVSDTYVADYYDDPSSWLDPTGPVTSGEAVVKGAYWRTGEPRFRTGFRGHVPASTREDIGIRCVHDAAVAP